MADRTKRGPTPKQNKWKDPFYRGRNYHAMGRRHVYFQALRKALSK